MTLYSIIFNVQGDDSEWAVDWHPEEDRWKLTCRDHSIFRRWYGYGNMDNNSYGKAAYLAILKAFQLSGDIVKLEDVAQMSPRSLAILGANNPVSKTIGDNRKASEVAN